MNTPSHAILNLAILGTGQLPQANLAIAVGGVLPDIPIVAFYVWTKFIQKLPEGKIWSQSYYQPFWQNLVALFHSMPLAAIAWLIAYYFQWQIIQLACLSLLLHSLLDLPVHHDDAHRHFFPLSDYRFISPISYWDPKHYGSIVALVELLLVLVATFYCFSFVQSWIGKGLAVASNLFYLTGYLYFYARSLAFKSGGY